MSSKVSVYVLSPSGHRSSRDFEFAKDPVAQPTASKPLASSKSALLLQWHVLPILHLAFSRITSLFELFVHFVQQSFVPIGEACKRRAVALVGFWGMSAIGREFIAGRCTFGLRCICSFIVLNLCPVSPCLCPV
jgi:hypothetical protein